MLILIINLYSTIFKLIPKKSGISKDKKEIYILLYLN